MMEKIKRIIFKLLIVLISVFLIDGGRSIFVVSNNFQIIFDKVHSNDVEERHQHHFANFSTDEKWMDLVSIDFSYGNHIVVNYSFKLISFPQEFSDSIWQPPKFV
jgi:hypothetical protein